MYLAAGRNALHASQGRASAADRAAEAVARFKDQVALAEHFNDVFAGGKWAGFMDQAYIGYASWNPPKSNNLDAVKLVEVVPQSVPTLGVAVEGCGPKDQPRLLFHRHGQVERYVEVFNRGKGGFDFSLSADVPWIVLGETRGTVGEDQRIPVRIDWRQVPADLSRGTITITGAGATITVDVGANHPAVPAGDKLAGYIEADGYVSIEAEHFKKKSAAGQNRWVRIQNYGHTLSGMRAEGPPDVLARPGVDSPCLEYGMTLFTSGEVEVETIAGSTLSFLAGRPVRYAVSFDDEPPREITIVPAVFEGYYTNSVWSESVRNNCHRIKSKHQLTRAGYHTLKIWMIDPGVVLQKILVDTGGLQRSYLGPAESLHVSE
jgi:hypothetical protein